MMTSVRNSRARTGLEQMQNQTQQKPRPQATAEQIRLAQMISDCSDIDFEKKVMQLVDITGKDQDESMIALHDCNGDVNRAINVLLEGSPDTDSWEMVGKKKSVSGPKETVEVEIREDGKEKENRDRGVERNVARRRGGASRRGRGTGRGTSRGQESHAQENGLDGAKAGGAPVPGAERGRRVKNRGRGGSGRHGGRFSSQAMGTFNPADYAEPGQASDGYAAGDAWNNASGTEPEDGDRLDFSGVEGESRSRKFKDASGPWRTATDEWNSEDWNEDLSETKTYTATSMASMPPTPQIVTITAGQRIDLAVLLGKTLPSSSSEAESVSLDASRPQVFSSSRQGVSLAQVPSGDPYRDSMAGLLNKSFGDVEEPKATCKGGTSGSQFLEQFKTAQALAQLAAQHTQISSSGSPGAWETSSSSLGQYDLNSQVDPLLHDQFTKRPAYQPTTSAASCMVEALFPGKPPSSSSCSAPSPTQTPVPRVPHGPGQQASPGSPGPQLQQHRLRQQKKKTSVSTKIPAQAVEMPASADVSGLSLQFGALQFGSEPVVPEYDSTPAAASPCNQVQNNLYSSASNESAPSVSSKEPAYQSSSLPGGGGPLFPIQTAVGGTGFDQRATQTHRFPTSVSTSTHKDMQPIKNGFSSRQAKQAVETAAGSAVSVRSVSDSVVPAPTSSMASLTDSSTGPASLLTTSNQTPLSTLGHSEDLPTVSVAQAQHSTSLPTQQNSLPTSSSARGSGSGVLHPSTDSESGLHSSFPSSSSVSSSSVSSSTSLNTVNASVGTMSTQPSLGAVGGLAVALSSPLASSSSSSSVAAASTSLSSRSSVASSGKVPPNLPPGVPPLIPNPYIVAPGLLHPYPPQVYGYDDLQMLQTRIPLDYYSIPFASPTTALTGREGSLPSNPYSAGELSKFGRGDASSPAPATSQTQQTQHSTQQQPFLNPALPPGYSYTSLPYYTGLASPFQYSPAVFPVAPTSSKQHGVNIGINASATPFQQASSYSSHGYNTGYEELGQTSGSGEFCKGGYGSAVAAATASAQGKPASTVSGPGVGVSVTSSNTGVPDISGSVYTKTQSFDKPSFHAGTPAASFSLPSALGSSGPINPPAAAAYPPAQFMHILAPHQQSPSQILHHHLQQDGQSGTGQRSQNSSIQQKSQGNKSPYNSYSWGAN